MSPGDDLESYLDNLEVTLRQCRVEDEDWIPYMMANLCGDNLALAQASRGGDDETYMVLKARLLAALGRTARAAGDKLTSLSAKDAMGQTATQAFHMVWKHVSRLLLDCNTMEQCRVAIALPFLRKLLPREGVAFLDTVQPTTAEDICDQLQQVGHSRVPVPRAEEREAEDGKPVGQQTTDFQLLQLRQARTPGI